MELEKSKKRVLQIIRMKSVWVAMFGFQFILYI